jgi:hypothetical protein
MSPAQRRFLLLEEGVGSVVVNFALNAAIAWLLFRGTERVPLWGQQSVVGDTIATSLILPFLTCLIVTPLVAGNVRRGRIELLPWTPTSHPVLGWLPPQTLRRAIVLAAAGGIVFAPITVLALDRFVASDMAFGHFIVFKASFAALEGLFVTPIVALWALAATARDAGTPSVPRSAASVR